MNEGTDPLRGRPQTFDDWVASFELERMNSQERELFLGAAKQVSVNPVLMRTLAMVEAMYLQEITLCQEEDTDKAERARLMLLAVRRLRGTLVAFAEDLKFELDRASKNQ